MKRPTARTAEADAQDFAEALQQGRLHPPKAEEAAAQHEAARAARGAERRKTRRGRLPNSLLSLPTTTAVLTPFSSERSTGMKPKPLGTLSATPGGRTPLSDRLGRLHARQAGDETRRSGGRQMVPEDQGFAAEGFADSLCMAADSYGWEGRSAWSWATRSRPRCCF